MNIVLNKYAEEGLSLEFNPLSHEDKLVVKSTDEPRYYELWALCQTMEEKALQSYKNAAKESKIDSFFEAARMSYLLRDGYQKSLRYLVLKEISFFVSSQFIFAHYSEKDVCYWSKIYVDGKYVTYCFIFEKQ